VPPDESAAHRVPRGAVDAYPFRSSGWLGRQARLHSPRRRLWGSRQRSWAKGEVELLQRHLQSASDSRVTFVYSNEASPPTYGDLFLVLMCLLYWMRLGIDIHLEIVDSEMRRRDWEALTPEGSRAFVADQIKLAQTILGPHRVSLTHAGTSTLAESLTTSDYAIGKLSIERGEPIYDKVPALLAASARAFGRTGLLQLTHRDIFAEEEQAPSRAPYVALHVRKGVWDDNRNFDAAQLSKDILQISYRFPKHDIMLLSNRKGIDLAQEFINRSPIRLLPEERQVSVIPQPEPGYLAAVNLALQAKFYFQRAGGGLCAPLWFSALPYLMIVDDDSALTATRKRLRAFHWARADQLFVVRGGDAQRSDAARWLRR
jgi:hypothetical protein